MERPAVRLMRREDIDLVWDINRRAFKTDAWSREAIEREFSLPYSIRYVLELGSEIVGYSILWLIKGEAFLMTFAIAPEYRGRGLGKYFLGEIIKDISGKARVLQLDVRKSNLPAIRLYRELGFKVRRERARFYSDGESALVMELEL